MNITVKTESKVSVSEKEIIKAAIKVIQAKCYLQDKMLVGDDLMREEYVPGHNSDVEWVISRKANQVEIEAFSVIDFLRKLL